MVQDASANTIAALRIESRSMIVRFFPSRPWLGDIQCLGNQDPVPGPTHPAGLMAAPPVVGPLGPKLFQQPF